MKVSSEHPGNNFFPPLSFRIAIFILLFPLHSLTPPLFPPLYLSKIVCHSAIIN
jgi:hypothetical protein